MNIFILNTGRCGSTTFIEACKHITNYSCAHESRSAALGSDRLNYSDNHIEADNRLSWLLGRLDKKYGDAAFYVHLKRCDSHTASSFSKRYQFGIIKAYRGNGILMGLPEESNPLSVCLDYCETVNSNIELFLKDKTNKMVINLESIEDDFKKFWHLINAEGNFPRAIEEFYVKHNATKSPADKNEQQGGRGYLVRKSLRKLKRILVKLPAYMKDAQ